MNDTQTQAGANLQGNRLQILMDEFEKQRQMLLQLCETQNALLSAALGNGELAASAPPASPAPTLSAVPDPVAPATPPAPAVDTTQTEPADTAAEDPEALVALFEQATSIPVASVDSRNAAAAEPDNSAPVVTDEAPTDLFEYLRSLMARAIEIPETDIDPDQNIMELGADSMTAMSLVKEVGQRYNLDLPATLLFEYTTLNELVEFLREELEN